MSRGLGDVYKRQALDAALVNTPVEYEAPFDVNETFAEAFEAHMSALS